MKLFFVFAHYDSLFLQSAVKLGVSPHGDLLHDVQRLAENNRYDFWVTASTNVGEGESTPVVSQSPHHKGANSLVGISGGISVVLSASGQNLGIIYKFIRYLREYTLIYSLDDFETG